MRILGIIPARGGSKGIPKKNIKNLNGHPMVSYTIRAALGCPELDTVMVSTDSEEIAEVARRHGAEVPFLRPAELALDTSKTIDCILHAVDTYRGMGEEFDAVAILQPTSPLRTAEDISGAVALFEARGEKGLVSVSEVNEHPILMRTMDAENGLESLLHVSSTIRRQDMPVYYRVDGAISIYKTSDLSPELSINDAPVGYVLEQTHAVDIDTYDDFLQAELLLKRESSHMG
jgi:CMP-N-acetylneuraminic acid synthetase